MKESNVLTQEIAAAYAGDYDIVVVGGGIAGCAAALAAVRMGKKVLLLEKQTMLGGLATSGHIVIYLPLDDGYGRQVMGGIAEELLNLSVKYSYGDDIVTWREVGRRMETRFNGPIYALALEELLLSEGVEILYDTLFVGCLMENGWCRAVLTENKSGREYYGCGAVIDASGDAEVLNRIGLNTPAAENSLAIWCYCTRGGEGHLLKRGGAAEHDLHLLTLGNIDKQAKKHLVVEPYYGDSGKNVNRFIQDGHKRLLSAVKEDENLVLASLPGMAQIRMSRRIEGAYLLGDKDSGKHFEDNIGATGDWRRPNPVYEIPYRSLYTNEVKNVLAAGRCIAAEEEAWQVTRVIPPAAVTGEAAGVAAALCLEEQKSVQEISVQTIRKTLASKGVMLDINKGE